MTKPTLQEQLIRGLIARGCLEAQQRYTGCRAFYHPAQPRLLYFVGSAGAFRMGHKRTGSRVVSEQRRQIIMSEGLALLTAEASR